MFSKEIKRQIVEAQNGYCATSGCYAKIHSVHHKLHDTSWNRKRYPLFINSPMNGVGLCYRCHRDRQWIFRVTEKEAETYETYLRNLKNE